MKLIKKILLYNLFLISIYNYGQKTEVSTIELTKSGLDVTSVFISDKEDNIISEPIFKYERHISINLKEIKGLTKVDNKYYPYFDFTIISKQGDTINELPRGRAIEVSSGKIFILIDENLRFSNFPLNPEAEPRGIL